MTREELIDKYNNLIIENRCDAKAVAMYKNMLKDLNDIDNDYNAFNSPAVQKLANWAYPHSFDIEYYEDNIYLKLYFGAECISQEDLNSYYATAVNLFDDKGYYFKGVREYFENNELCFTYCLDKELR